MIAYKKASGIWRGLAVPPVTSEKPGPRWGFVHQYPKRNLLGAKGREVFSSTRESKGRFELRRPFKHGGFLRPFFRVFTAVDKRPKLLRPRKLWEYKNLGKPLASQDPSVETRRPIKWVPELDLGNFQGRQAPFTMGK